jgi:MtN3 and saliva related transmembrane protein
VGDFSTPLLNGERYRGSKSSSHHRQDATCIKTVPVVLNQILQIVAVTATAVAWVPQAVKTLRTSDTRGLSVESWALGGATGLLFMLYGLRSGVWGLLLSEGAFALGAFLILLVAVGWKKMLIWLLLSLVISVALITSVPAVGIGVLGLLGALGMRVLQIRRTWVTASTAGMSSWSWVLLVVSLAAWGLYGYLSNHWPLLATSVSTLLASVILLIVARLPRSTGSSHSGS